MMLIFAPRFKRVRILILTLIITFTVPYTNPQGVYYYLSYTPQDGDIVFQSMPHNQLIDAIEGITNSSISHVGTVRKNVRGNWVVIEALAHAQETPLLLWIIRGRKAAFQVYHLKHHEVIPAFLREAEKMIGKPYDIHYSPDDENIYCSELIWKAYERATHESLGEWDTLGSLDWTPFENLIRVIESGKLPLERKIITPVGLTRSTELEFVVGFGDMRDTERHVNYK